MDIDDLDPFELEYADELALVDEEVETGKRGLGSEKVGVPSPKKRRKLSFTPQIDKSNASTNESEDLDDKMDVEIPRKRLQIKKRYLWTCPPSNNACDVTVTTPNGGRYFMKVRKERVVIDKEDQSEYSLPVSVRDMLKEIDEERVASSKDVENEEQEQQQQQQRQQSSKKSELWVNKYAPRRFVDLLSSDKINRDVLHWIKKWDSSVFGVQAPKVNKRGERKNREEDEDRMPVILLCGPAGMGKTTLAHIAAIHAGYEPLEINASDERNKNSLMIRVRAALEMQSVFTKEGERQRPRLPIIDEIDGAVGGSEGRSAIEALVKYIQSSQSSNKGKSVPRRPIICVCNNQFAPTLRPLRKIAQIHVFERTRQVKLVRRLKQVCKREGISTSERALKMMTDLLQRDVRACLHMLQFVHRRGVRRKGGGSRVHSLNEEELCRYAIAAASSGVSGGMASDTSIFQSLGELFYVGKKTLSSSKKITNVNHNEWDRSGNLVRLHGGRDGVDFLRAMHENVLSVGLSDPTLHRSAYMIDLITESIECHALAKSKQQYEWLKYVPCAVYAARNIFKANVRGGFHNSRFVFERLDSNSSRLRSQRVELLRTFISTAHLALGTRAPRSFVLDMLSSYVSLLRPCLKSRGATTGSWQLLSADDREALRGVVQLMASTGVTYKPSFNDNANNQSSSSYFQRKQFGHKFALEPNIESLTTFSFTEAPKRETHTLSEPMKKFLRREIQNAAIRGRFTTENSQGKQQERLVEERSKTSGWRKYMTKPVISPIVKQQSLQDDDEKKANGDKETKQSKSMNFLQRARAVAMKQKRKRLRSKSSSSSNIESSSSSSSSTRSDENKIPSAKKRKPVVIFRYEEGFSNAVRRPVTISDFLSKHDMAYAATQSPSKMF